MILIENTSLQRVPSITTVSNYAFYFFIMLFRVCETVNSNIKKKWKTGCNAIRKKYMKNSLPL